MELFQGMPDELCQIFNGLMTALMLERETTSF
jgi:hypothetical protein